MKLETGVGLTIGIPTLGRPLVMEWATAWKALSPPINYNTRVALVYGKPVHQARNEIAEQAIKDKSKYLFFLGDDVEVPAHTLKQLIFRMEHDESLGVVGGIYCSKSEPSSPLVFRGNGKGCYWDWKLGEFFEVTGLGMDCTMIRVKMLEEMGGPWFNTVDTDQYLDAINSTTMWTEDLWFLKRVMDETDYKIYADGMIICKHWESVSRTSYTLPADSKPLKIQQHESGTKKVVDLGCGDSHIEFEEGKAIRVDAREEVNPDYRCDLRSLPFDNDEFDIAFSSHTLEHFGREEVSDVLDEWIRIIKPGGELRIVVPNLEWAAQQIVDGKLEDIAGIYSSMPAGTIPSWDVMNVLYGQQEYGLNFHKVGFTPKTLRLTLESKGMEILQEDVEMPHGYNIFIRARKQHSSAPERKDTRIDQRKKIK